MGYRVAVLYTPPTQWSAWIWPYNWAETCSRNEVEGQSKSKHNQLIGWVLKQRHVSAYSEAIKRFTNFKRLNIVCEWRMLRSHRQAYKL